MTVCSYSDVSCMCIYTHAHTYTHTHCAEEEENDLSVANTKQCMMKKKCRE